MVRLFAAALLGFDLTMGSLCYQMFADASLAQLGVALFFGSMGLIALWGVITGELG